MGYFKHERAMVHEGAQIGEGTRIWANTNIQNGAIIGKNCNICDGTFVEKGAVIGNNVTIKHYVSVFDGITIEDDVFIGSNIAFINDRFPRSNNGGNWTLEKVTVKKGATIGTNAVIMCGITIGEYAMIGAGSVVCKDVKRHELVVGNPGKVIGYVAKNGKRLDNDLVDTEGNRYQIGKDGLEML
ncbi:MAG: N-acetyltransferase [Candidatus Omnitrophica bacterium]|nr:N-acetyltransferase [Candidatus Omnitrophota bacterium]